MKNLLIPTLNILLIRVLLLLPGIFCATFTFCQTDSLALHKTEIPISGKTQGILPYLKYGPGADRLGGAKMTYLDTAIMVMVVDSLKNDYIVRLSKNHHAFIPKENVRLFPGVKRNDYFLTSSWTVSGDERQDYVSIHLDGRLPYNSIQMIEPSRIVVDIYGATGNTNWITQLQSAKEIKNVSYEQTEDDVFRVTIFLKHQQHWGHSISYKNKTLVIAIKRQPRQLSLRHLKIAVDAGHGGSNTGATGVTSNLNEKEFNLKIAKELEKYLKRRGAEVFLTRNADEELSMTDRINSLKAENPDLLISIHHNASGNAGVKGVSTYYRHIGFKPLTVHVLDNMLKLGLADFGNIGSFNFSLNGPTEYPNCLVEVAFMSNKEDEKRIMDPKFQRDVAKKIRNGITEWLRKL
ncbi:MAG: N-acetylmuramoyl-L-alanine amidase [Prolixibacteraceae bacterium]